MNYKPDKLYRVFDRQKQAVEYCYWCRGVFHRYKTGSFVAYDWQVSPHDVIEVPSMNKSNLRMRVAG